MNTAIICGTVAMLAILAMGVWAASHFKVMRKLEVELPGYRCVHRSEARVGDTSGFGGVEFHPTDLPADSRSECRMVIPKKLIPELTQPSRVVYAVFVPEGGAE